MLTDSSWFFRFGWVFIALGACVAQLAPVASDQPRAHGRELVGEYKVAPEAIERYAKIAARAAMHGPPEEGSGFGEPAPWVGPQQLAGLVHHSYTLVLTVRGEARAPGEATTQWQTGWKIEETPHSEWEVLLNTPRVAAQVSRAGEPVTLQVVGKHVNFRGERVVAPILSFGQARNLDIHDVDVQLWSGLAPIAWPALPASSVALLLLAAACLLRDILLGGAMRGAPGMQALRTALQRCSRIELPTTSKELAAIPNPAAQGGSAPASASGTHSAL